MRCQPNDICLVVDSHSALKQALGRIVCVTMLELHPCGTLVWQLSEPMRVTLVCDALYRGEIKRGGTTVTLLSIYDNWLRPLRHRDGEDEILRHVGSPNTGCRVATAKNDAAHSSLRDGGAFVAAVGRKPGRDIFFQ